VNQDSISFAHYNDAALHNLRRRIVKDLRDSLLVLPDKRMFDKKMQQLYSM
jgi:hypothetical protein